MRHHARKARIELLTLFLLSISFGMGIAALGSLPSNNLPASPVQSPPSGTYFDHVVFIMMENEGIGNICGNGILPPCVGGTNTPYEAGLANNFTISENYTSVYRPLTSQPNYVAIIGGSTFTCPSTCTNINAPTLIDRLQGAGLSWKAYMETMPLSKGCATSDSLPYDSIHNPFISFKEFVNSGVSNATMCNNIVTANPSGCGPVTDCTLVNDLNNSTSAAPSFMWLTPNDCNNMHAASICTVANGYNGCTSGGSSACIKGGDNYLKSLVPNILNSQTFKTTRSALFITFDEGQDFCPRSGKSN
ncbi:MAG TPA: alkaline phosphatase family protein, partial [Candidatus Bathyarchaeia archaeon]|nr:alkaline phosphatase family protein [Candidatus Bathyarchaeia archaeon]